VAANGEAGLALFAKSGADAAIVDINMPGHNGVEVCRMLGEQARRSGRKLPVWLMTGAIGAYVEELGLKAGALKVLHKPFNISEFTAELDEQLRSEAPVAKQPRSGPGATARIAIDRDRVVNGGPVRGP